VTNYVKAQKAAGKSPVSFALIGTTSMSAIAQFNSDEATGNRPELRINSQQQPPTGGKTTTSVAAARVEGDVNANTNYGSSTELGVKRSDNAPDFARKSYLKFDLSGITSITSATLRLFGRLSDTRLASLTTNVYSASNTGWSESGITWNNKPQAGTTVLASATVSGATSRWYELDLTRFLQAEKAAGRNLVTLVLKNASGGASRTIFNSDEAVSNRPQIVVR
jgi:hypothetical protein